MIALVGYGYWGKNLARVFRDELKFIVDKNDANLSKAKYLLNWEPKKHHKDLI